MLQSGHQHREHMMSKIELIRVRGKAHNQKEVIKNVIGLALLVALFTTPAIIW